MRQGIEILVLDSRKISQLYTAVFMLRLFLSTVHSDVVAALYQTGGDLLGKSLESAVTCRNTPRTEQCDPHQTTWGSLTAPDAAGTLTGCQANQLQMYSSETRRRFMIARLFRKVAESR